MKAHACYIDPNGIENINAINYPYPRGFKMCGILNTSTRTVSEGERKKDDSRPILVRAHTRGLQVPIGGGFSFATYKGGLTTTTATPMHGCMHRRREEGGGGLSNPIPVSRFPRRPGLPPCQQGEGGGPSSVADEP